MHLTPDNLLNTVCSFIIYPPSCYSLSLFPMEYKMCYQNVKANIFHPYIQIYINNKYINININI